MYLCPVTFSSNAPYGVEAEIQSNFEIADLFDLLSRRLSLTDDMLYSWRMLVMNSHTERLSEPWASMDDMDWQPAAKMPEFNPVRSGSVLCVVVLPGDQIDTWKVKNNAVLRAFFKLNTLASGVNAAVWVVQFDPHSHVTFTLDKEDSVTEVRLSFAPLFSRCKLSVEAAVEKKEKASPPSTGEPGIMIWAYPVSASHALPPVNYNLHHFLTPLPTQTLPSSKP